LARVKVGVRDPDLILPSTEITTDPNVYDAYYEVEEVVENGEVMEGVSRNHCMDVDVEIPNKRMKGAVNEGEGNQSEGSKKERYFCTEEKLTQFVKDKTAFRLEFELNKMERDF
jgi:hypothetical protein